MSLFKYNRIYLKIIYYSSYFIFTGNKNKEDMFTEMITM